MRTLPGTSGHPHTATWPVLFLALFLLLISGSPALAALWYENYSKAEEALEAGNYAQAVDLLETALSQKGESGASVRTYGVNLISYFPYLKLGVARYNLGEYDAALLSFEAEERAGAITRSTRDYDELKRYRQLAQEAKAEAEAVESRRIVAAALTEARSLEQRGELDAALIALERAKAVALDSEEVQTALQRLRAMMSREQQQRELELRVADLVARGRQLLADGQYGEASSLFTQAQALLPSDETQRLVDDAKSRLAAELESQRDDERRHTMVSDGLRRAAEFEATGDYARGLNELQTVLVLEPGNQQATELHARLLDAQSEADKASSIQTTVEDLLAEVEEKINAGEYEQALTLANRVLALEPANRAALRQMNRAYEQLARQIYGSDEPLALPARIYFAGTRAYQVEKGRLAESIENADFQLFGTVLSTSLAQLTVHLATVDLPCPLIERNETYEQRPEYEERELLQDQDWQMRPISDSNSDAVYTAQFVLRQSMPSGCSRIRVVTLNESQIPSTYSYEVLYSRPWFQSPWLYAAAGIALLFVAGAFYVVKLRKRRALFKRRFNPYIAGAPVLKDDLFFGREKLLSRVLQTVHNNSILLYGERRIGKTSFQHLLKRRLQQLQDDDYRFFPVFIDLQGTPQERFFATLGEDVFEELAPHLDGLQPNPALADPPSYGYKELLRDIRAALKVLKKNNDKHVKIVLLIDEVDELNDYDPKINQRLRSLFMRSFAEDLVAVVSGVGIKKHWESEGSPWYNFFEEIPVTPFRKEIAAELIERPVRGIFKLERDAVDRIITLSDSRPYIIQKFCVAVVNRAHDQKSRRISVADVDAVAEQLEV